MVLYALVVLPLISICDEDTYDDMFADLIVNLDSYDSATFADHLKLIQDRYECIGITCEMVGVHKSATAAWPGCSSPSTAIAGYVPTTDASLEVSLILR